MTEYKHWPFEEPNPEKQIPIEIQKQNLDSFIQIRNRILDKALVVFGKERYKTWYSIECENFERKLIEVGYSHSDMSHTLAYHPMIFSGPNESHIYSIDFSGDLSIKKFFEDLEARLDKMLKGIQ